MTSKKTSIPTPTHLRAMQSGIEGIIKGAVTLEPCGCKSKEVTAEDGTKGRSVTPCEAHTFLQISTHLSEAARMFSHLAQTKMKS